MTLTLMQQVDKILGGPICWLLRWFTPTARTLAGDTRPQIPRRVICTKFIGIGSVTLALPMLKALKDSGVEVAFWTFSPQADLLRISGCVDHVWVAKPTLLAFPATLLKGLWNAIRFRADAFIDLEQTANCSAILARLSGAPVRVGFLCGKPLRESMFTHLVSLTAGRHMCDSILLMAQAVNVSADAQATLPPIAPGKIRECYEFKTRKNRVIVNVNTSDLGRNLRQWPDDHWVALCRDLLKDQNVELVFPGVRSEHLNNQRIIDRLLAEGVSLDRMINLAGKSNLTELLSILKTSSLVISVDSGVMHLAAWVGVPVVGLFGPETPQLYAPRTKKSKVIWAALPCSPCCTVATEKHTRCRDNQCMKRISPAQVLVAQKALLSELAREATPAA